MNSDYLVGTVLENRYEILEMIGSGGMATVYKAKCRVLNRFVAIKVLKDSLKYEPLLKQLKMLLCQNGSRSNNRHLLTVHSGNKRRP